jgi:hypothetical protein
MTDLQEEQNMKPLSESAAMRAELARAEADELAARS